MNEIEYQNPLPISVVLNVWGKDDPLGFRRSLDSVKNQKVKPDQVLIVVDGPINELLEREIEDFIYLSSINVGVIRVPIAMGLWNARNVGIYASTNDVVAMHDADDVMHPVRLEHQFAEFSKGDVDVLGCPVYEFDAQSEQILSVRALGKLDIDMESLIWRNTINHSTVMLRKSAFNSVGGYRNIYLAEDYDLWLRLARSGFILKQTSEILQAFSVDPDLNMRRGGSRFISSELVLHRLVSSYGCLGKFKLSARLLMRLAFRLGPNSLRRISRKLFFAKRLSFGTANLEYFYRQEPGRIIKNG